MTQPATGAGAAGAASLSVTVDTLAAGLVALYTDAEQQLLDSLARVARHGFTDTTARAQAVMYAQMRTVAQRVATQLTLHAAPLSHEIAREAAERGDAAAQAMLRRLIEADPKLARLYLTRVGAASGHGVSAAAQIGLELAGRLHELRRGILRFADDAYRAAVAEAATRLVLGREALTPATAQRLAWQELTRLGVTGYTDTAGRRWNLASYVEMATRTAVQRAYNEAHLARMTAVGIEWFTVSHDGHPCPLCGPWEGAILSHGRVGIVTAEAADSDRQVAFRVKATVDQARAAGLQHPNCRHVFLPYLPGVTKTGAGSRWTAADQRRYDAIQQLRYLERQVRAWKRAQAAALDDIAKKQAARKVRAYQARIRQHVDQHQLVRRSRREQLNLGNR